jgi:hypothetical protein
MPTQSCADIVSRGSTENSRGIKSAAGTIQNFMRKPKKAVHCPDQFWSYAFGNAVYVNNRLLTSRSNNDNERELKTPFKLFKRHTSDIRKIAMNGAACVSRIPNPRAQLKLSARGRFGVILGNSERHNDALSSTR